MILDFIEITIEWPEEITVFDLRKFILNNLENYGEPLRWAITDVYPHISETLLRKLKIEAVVIRN